MAKMRNLLVLMTVVLHLTALLVPMTAHAAIGHAAGSYGDMHTQADHHAQPDDLCCATADGNAPLETDGFCAICAVSCTGIQATLEAVGPLSLALSSTRHLAIAEQTLRSAAPEAALRPPRARS